MSSISTSAEAGYSFYSVTGVVTPRSIGQLVDYACSKADAAMVVSYENAVIAIEPDELFSYAWAQRDPAHPMEAPAALVVRLDQLSLFRQYADAALQNGLIRATFTARDEACAWAAQQAVVQEQWLRAHQLMTTNEEWRRKSTS